jgi:hypothetical protein
MVITKRAHEFENTLLLLRSHSCQLSLNFRIEVGTHFFSCRGHFDLPDTLYHPDSTCNIDPHFIACSEASPACGFAWHIGVVGTDERLAVGGDGLDGRHVLAALDDVAVLLESRDSICVDLAVDDEDVG